MFGDVEKWDRGDWEEPEPDGMPLYVIPEEDPLTGGIPAYPWTGVTAIDLDLAILWYEQQTFRTAHRSIR